MVLKNLLQQIEEGLIVFKVDCETGEMSVDQVNPCFCSLFHLNENCSMEEVKRVMECLVDQDNKNLSLEIILNQVYSEKEERILTYYNKEEKYALKMTWFIADIYDVGILVSIPADKTALQEKGDNNFSRIISDIGDIGGFQVDYGRSIVSFSTKAKEILGIEDSDNWFPLEHFASLIIKDDQIRFSMWLKSINEKQSIETVVFRINYIKSVRFVAFRGVAKFKKGHIFINGTIQNVTKNYKIKLIMDEEILRSKLGARAAKLCFFKYDINEETQEVDDYWYEMVGLKEHYANMHPYYMDNIHPEDKEAVLELFSEVDSNKEYRIDFRFFNRAEDRYIWLSQVAILVEKIDRPSEYIFLGSYQNIDVEKRSREERDQLANMLDIGMRNGQVDIWDLNMVTNIITLRTSQKDVFGLEKSMLDLHLHRFIQFIHHQDRKYFEANIRNLRESKEPEFKINFRYMVPNTKKIIWLKVVGKVTEYDSLGKPTRCVGIAQDITNFYISEGKLRKSKERLRQASHIAHLGSWEYSAKTQMVELLEGVHEILGISRFEERFLISRKDFIHFAIKKDRDKLKEIFNDEHKWLQYDEHFFADVGNQRKKMHIIATYKYDRNGNLMSIIGTIQDISVINALEQALRQAEKMTAVGQLAGGIAHDFNNILMATSGYTELIKIKSDQQVVKDYCDKIISSIERSTDLTRKLLAFSRKDSLIKNPVPLHQCIESAIGIISRTIDKNIDLSIHLDAEFDLVFADATEIQNVIINLCLNARDAMPYGGTISIYTSVYSVTYDNRMVGDVELQRGDYVKIVVQDTGFGIEDKHLNKIFDPFFTTKEVGKGTGLGLSAALGTIMSHQGAIEVESAIGIGTKFTLYLPVYERMDES